MDRGELSGDGAIDVVLRELDFQSKTKGIGFNYDFNGRFAKEYLSRTDQEDILRTLNRQGSIKLRVESASNNTLESSSDEDVHWIELFIIDSLNISLNQNTPNPLSGNTVGLSFRDGTLSISINSGKYKPIANLTDGLKPFQLFEALFSKPAGVVIPSADIFNGRLNLKQIITKSKLGHILPFLDESALPYSIARKDTNMEFTNSELKEFLTKLNEKYRSNFIEYL